MSSVSSSTVLTSRTRRSAPKAKTGCATCKARRIKCDEGKPYCKRCTSTGRKCDGYTQNALVHTHFGAFAVTQPSLALRSGPNLHLTGENIEYLEFYHQYAVSSISTGFDKEFWSKIPLQLAQSELCVRHALVALSYLNKSETGTLKHARSSLLSPPAPKQNKFLVNYNKSVNSLVQRISEPSYCPEVGLVCCLLFVCIEFLRGDYDTAFAHFRSGLSIISAYRKDEIQYVKDGTSYSMIERTLIPIFARLVTTALAYGLPTEQVFYTSSFPIGTHECVFSSLQEAQASIYNISNHTMIIGRNLGQQLLLNGFHTEEDLKPQRDSLESQRTWLRALEKLESGLTMSKEDVITMHCLKAQHYCLYIVNARAIVVNQTDFDQHLGDFKALVHHSRFVVNATGGSSSSPAANFTFDIGVILCIYLAACRCRCPTTRREALELLSHNLPREGLWDAQQHYLVAKRIIELEECELDPLTGWPVESTRIWSTMIHGDVDENGGFWAYFAKGHWGEGRGKPPLPPDWLLEQDPTKQIWREWFVL